jgi:hypothetical protein
VKLWKLIFATAGIIAICLLCGLPVWGAEPKADTLRFDISTDGKTLMLTPNVPAKIRITTSGPSTGSGLAAVVINGLPDIADWTATVIVNGNPSPQPNPQPNPGPTPNPTPTPGPLYVLVVYESADFVKMPITQVSILTSKPIRDYLTAHCAKSSQGAPEFRFLDKDADVKKLDANLQKWFAEAAAKMKATGKPWLAVTNGKDSISKELPATPDAFLETLKPIGGK